MPRLTVLCLMVLSASVPGRGEEPGYCCKPHCTVPPPPRQPNCASCPCDHRLSCTLYPPEHARELIASLASPDFCKRRAAVEQLGNRLHADACRDPAVAEALVRALHCDTCWEVRRAAAWALFHQGARGEEVVLALYLSSRLDPHYMVRIRAAEAMDLLTLGRRECYEELYKAADRLVGVLQEKGYQPGRDCLLSCKMARLADGRLAISTRLPGAAEELPPPTAEPEAEKVPIEKIPLGK